jgi:hypothetical protein
MKRTIYIGIGAALAAILFGTLSMTIGDAYKDRRFGGNPQSGITLVVPAKPSSTKYVGYSQLNEYLKNGYQVQQVVTGDYNTPTSHHFLMVKY